MIEQIVNAGIEALKNAYLVQKKLSDAGTINEFSHKGNGTDKALKGDWESEEAVIKTFEQFRFPIRIISEEHGQIDIVENPLYIAVLDGFDGSSALKANPRARGGTMLSIAANLNPTYTDFIFGGLTEFCQDQILYAVQGNGAFLIKDIKKESEIVEKVKINQRELFGRQSPIHLDDPSLYEHAKGITSGLDEIGKCVNDAFTKPLQRENFTNLSALNSSSAMCFDLVIGNVDAVCGVIAKGVFEPSTEYVLLREVSGSAYGKVNETWEEIGDRRWSEYGRPLSPLIRVANPKIGKGLISFLNIDIKK
jgi:fructose-1,6-bisphosphatase/inositol monophosphatase family enzyme